MLEIPWSGDTSSFIWRPWSIFKAWSFSRIMGLNAYDRLLSLFLLLSLWYTGAVKGKNRAVDGALGNTVTRPVFFPPGEAWQRHVSGVFFHLTGLAHSTELGALVASTHLEQSLLHYHSKVCPLFVKIGTAIYIFFITLKGENFTKLTECNFVIDGQKEGSFRYAPDRSLQDIQYEGV